MTGGAADRRSAVAPPPPLRYGIPFTIAAVVLRKDPMSVVTEDRPRVQARVGKFGLDVRLAEDRSEHRREKRVEALADWLLGRWLRREREEAA